MADESTPLLNNADVENGMFRLGRCLPAKPRWIEENMSAVKTVAGYSLIILAGLFFTTANVIQKIVAPELNFWHLLFFRAIAQMVIMAADIFRRRIDIWGRPELYIRIRIFFQGLLGGLLLLCIFVAIKHVPLGNSSAIFFCTPVFTFIFAICMLREGMGLYRILISAFMLVGVTLITRPPVFFDQDAPYLPANSSLVNVTTDSEGGEYGDEGFSAVGYFCAVLVPLLSAIVSILTRQLKELHASVLMFWFAVGTFVVGIGGLTFTSWSGLFKMSTEEWVYTFTIVFLGILGNMSYTFAVRWISPSKGNVFRSFEVILNYVLQLTLEHSEFHFSSIFGIVFLLCAVGLTGFESEAMQKFGQRFKFL